MWRRPETGVAGLPVPHAVAGARAVLLENYFLDAVVFFYILFLACGKELGLLWLFFGFHSNFVYNFRIFVVILAK